ncbi:Blue-light-activated protein [Gemmata sp. SH-PL17]|uniref:PAS domain S-box protein n=1 Tax=Gemmata sp. SH-PL17 TaxID=1630693 RepID=UPI0004ADB7E2|nr:PAS domain S-box protein [Gemmata sp. SH-PL17]AMV29198.1 Blue-light-activated protein [Gemmata sp. SH-PL17]
MNAPLSPSLVAHALADPYRLLVEAATDVALCALDSAGRVVTWNTGAERLTGYPRGDAVGRSLTFLYPTGAGAEQLEQVLRGALERGRVEEFGEWAGRGGALFTARWVTTALFEGGHHVGFAVALRAESPVPAPADRTGSDAELRRLRAIVDHTVDGVVVADTDGNLLEWNPAALRMHGFADLDSVRCHFSTFTDMFVLSPLGGEPLPCTEWPVSRLIRGESVGCELHVRRTDVGREWIIRYDGTVVPDPAGGSRLVVLTLHDVTEQRRAEADSRRSADLLRAVADGTTDAVFVKDRDGKYLLCNEAGARCVGRPVSEVLGTDDAALFDAESARLIAERDQRVMESGRAETSEEVLTAVGVTRAYQATKAPYRDAAGAVIGVVGISRDVTERKRAEESLVLFRALVDRTTDGIEVIDPETGRYLDVNEKACLIHGYTREEYLGLTVTDVEPGAAWRSWAEGAGDTGTFEGRRRRKGGATFPVEVRANRVRLDREYLVAVVRDLTRRKMAEESLEQAHALLRTLIDTLPDAIWTKDTNGQFVTSNRAHNEMVGARAESDVIGKTGFDFHPLKLARRYHEDDMRVLHYGETVFNKEDLVHTQGRERWHLVSKVPLRDRSGAVTGLVGISRNIQALKEAENTLRASEARTKAVIQTALDCIIVIDAQGRVLEFNPAAERVFGCTRGEVLGTEMADLFIPPEHRDAHRAGMLRYLATGEGPVLGRRLELPALRKGGERFVAELSIGRNPGDPPTFTGFLRDITDRKRDEEALRQERDRFARLAAVSPGVIHSFRLRPDGTRCFPYASPRIADIYGVPPEALAENTLAVRALVHPDDMTRLQADLAESARTMSVWHSEHRVQHPVRGEIWVEYRSAPAREPDGSILWHGVLTDVTERKRAQVELDRRRAELELILDTVPALIFFKDRAHRLVRVNRELARLVGRPRGELEGRTDEELGSPHAARYHRDEDAIMASGRPLLGVIEPLHTATGTRWLQTDKVPYRDGTGTVAGVVGFAIDVTDRRVAEEALRRTQERLRSVISSSPAVLYTHTVESGRIGGIAWMSENVRGMLGFAPEDVADRAWWGVNAHPEDRDRVTVAAGKDLFANGRVTEEYRVRHRSGQYRWVRAELRLVRASTGEPVEVVGSWSDVTERKQVEEQFRQAQKMEAVGRLAGGVAHDFNNLLTIINGYADLLIGSTPAADPTYKAITAIAAAGERAAGLTAQLLAFSRKAIIEPKVLDLNELVSQSARLLARLIGEDVTLSTVLDPGLARVKVDPGQIEQVVMNLVVNARDAMPTGGRLTIETRALTVVPGDAACPDVEPGGYAQLNVSDTGSGMTDEVKARIFEPFFTTKEQGKGTGLGLATVYGIVKTYGGHIDVHSEVGAGTTFKLLFPVVTQEAPRSAAAETASAPRGAETVLLVEDDAGVRGVAKIALRTHGYEVLEADCGADAVRVIARHPGVIHLLITDVVMPGVGGREVAEAVRARYPGVKVVYMSGYTDDAVVRHGIGAATDAFLQKPFTPFSLARKVREVLDG